MWRTAAFVTCPAASGYSPWTQTSGVRCQRPVPSPLSAAPPKRKRPQLHRGIANSEHSDPASTVTSGRSAPQLASQEDSTIPRILLGALATAGVAVVVTTVTSGGLSLERLQAFAIWIDQLGPSGRVAYALIYFLLELVAVPAAPLTLAAGYLFGPVQGSLIVSAASTAAAASGFLIARYALRSFVRKQAIAFPAFRSVDRAIAKEGFKNVLLLRLSPLLPFSISNYLYGLTAVNFVPYTVASWLGMLPGTLAYVYAGSAFDELTDIGERSGAASNPVLLGVGITATVLIIRRLGVLAGEAIKADAEEE